MARVYEMRQTWSTEILRITMFHERPHAAPKKCYGELLIFVHLLQSVTEIGSFLVSTIEMLLP